MFASNFPVDGLTGSYADIMGGFLEIPPAGLRPHNAKPSSKTQSRITGWTVPFLDLTPETMRKPRKEMYGRTASFPPWSKK